MKIAELTGADFERENKSVGILPVGSIERHGDHLPLGTDGALPTYIAEMAAEETGSLLLPTVWYGSCNAMREFPGTFDIDADALYKYAYSIMAEAMRNSIKLLIVLNGHGGNSAPLQMAARQVSSKSSLSVMVIDWWRELGKDEQSMFESPGHAGEDETSAMLALSQDKVNIWLAGTHEVEYPKLKIYSKALDERIYSIALTGDAKKATKEKGVRLLGASVQDLIRIINETRDLLLV
jgi:creatinine amidohydrolase